MSNARFTYENSLYRSWGTDPYFPGSLSKSSMVFPPINDRKAIQVIRKSSGAANAEEFFRLPIKMQAGAFRCMKKTGASLW